MEQISKHSLDLKTLYPFQSLIENTSLFPLTLSQTINFGLFQIEFADYSLKFDENFTKFSKPVKAISPFPISVFKKSVLQTRKNQGSFGKGIT